jgi:anti-sigma B factor antagonist
MARTLPPRLLATSFSPTEEVEPMSTVFDGSLDAVPAHMRGWIEVSGLATAVVLRISGELDAANRDVIEPAVMAAIASSPGGVILDLGELTFCDSRGVAMFVDLGEKAKAQGTDLAARHPLPPVRRVFELAALDRHIRLIE